MDVDAFRILLMRHFVRGDACQDPRGFLKLLRKRDAGLSGKNPKHPGLVMIILSVTHRVSRSWDLVMRLCSWDGGAASLGAFAGRWDY